MTSEIRHMTCAIRHAFAVLPLGLILAGCAGPQGSVSSAGRAERPSALVGGRTTAVAVDRSGAKSHETPVFRITGERSTAMVVDRSSSRSDETPASRIAEPSPPNPQHDITLDQIREHVQNGTATLIDARSPEHFASGHVRGALNLPAGEEMDAYLAKIRQDIPPDQLIIIYCVNRTCESSDMVYEFLETQGFTNMRVYTPGWQVLASAKM